VYIFVPVHTIVAGWPTRIEIDDGATEIEGDIALMIP